MWWICSTLEHLVARFSSCFARIVSPCRKRAVQQSESQVPALAAAPAAPADENDSAKEEAESKEEKGNNDEDALFRFPALHKRKRRRPPAKHKIEEDDLQEEEDEEQPREDETEYESEDEGDQCFCIHHFERAQTLPLEQDFVELNCEFPGRDGGVLLLFISCILLTSLLLDLFGRNQHHEVLRATAVAHAVFARPLEFVGRRRRARLEHSCRPRPRTDSLAVLAVGSNPIRACRARKCEL